MNTVLFLSLVIILSAALPWWPNSAYGRSQHHRLRDKQPPAYETKIFNHEALQKAAVKLKALDVRPTPEASPKAAGRYGLLWGLPSGQHQTDCGPNVWVQSDPHAQHFGTR